MQPSALALLAPGAAAEARSVSHLGRSQLWSALQVALIGGAGAWAARRLKAPGGILVGAAIGCSFDVAAVRQIRALLLWATTPLDLDSKAGA